MRNSNNDDKHLLSIALHMLDVLVNLILTKLTGKVLRHNKEVSSGAGIWTQAVWQLTQSLVLH